MDGNNENIYGTNVNDALMKKDKAGEMRRCLRYMSGLWGADKALLIVAFIMLAIFKQNSFTLVWIIYGVNAMSLSIYGNNYGVISAVGGHEKLTLSLPMSRKTIYDTRMYLAGGLYLLAIVLAFIPFLHVGMLYKYNLSVLLLLMGHAMCGLSIRRPYLQIVSGIPVCIALVLAVMFDLSNDSRTIVQVKANSRWTLVIEGCLSIIMLIIDITVWLRERRLFIGNNGYKSSNDKNYKIDKDENGKVKAIVFKTGRTNKLLIISACILISLLPIGIASIPFIDYEMQNNRNGVCRYLLPDFAECGYRDIGESDGLNVKLYNIKGGSFCTTGGFFSDERGKIGLQEALSSGKTSIDDMIKYPFEREDITIANKHAKVYGFENYSIVIVGSDCIICPSDDIPELEYNYNW